MKVKTIGEINTCTLDKQINEFIKGKHVIDIEFSSFFDEIGGASFSALIMYEEIGI
nr:MAG TPA: Sporulation protein Cse60 [Caudoviricetes sp.]